MVLIILRILLKKTTCYKNLDNPSCIDLIFTNRQNLLQDTRVIETGLYDFHKLTATVFKVYFKKEPPKIISYRDYKNFTKFRFRNELDQLRLRSDLLNISNDEFVNIFMTVFNKHAPLKTKYVRANDGPFTTKDLRKAMMSRSNLQNKLKKNKTLEVNLAYKRQRNLCTSLVKKAKREYYANLNPSVISDNKKFCRTIKPLFSDNVTTSKSITLVENQDICSDNEKVALIFNAFFSNVVNKLNIERNDDILNDNITELDPVHKAIKKYDKRPSILEINEIETNKQEKISFQPIELESIIQEILALDTSKASPNDSISPKIIKDNCDIFSKK